MKYKREDIMSGVVGVLLKLLSLTIGFLVSFGLAAVLPKSQYGVYSLLMSLFLLCLVFANVGVNHSAINIVPKCSKNEEVRVFLRTAVQKSFFWTTITAVLAGIFYVNSVETKSAVFDGVIFFIGLLLFNYHSLNISILRGVGKFKLALLLENIVLNVSLFVLIFVVSGRLDWEIIIGFLGGFFALFLSSVFFVIRIVGVSVWDYIPLRVSLVRPDAYFILAISEAVITNLDVLAVNVFFTHEDSAEYFLAKKFLVVFSMVFIVYNIYASPKISRCFRDGEKIDRLKVEGYLKLNKLVVFFSALLSLIGYLSFDDALTLLGIEGYSQAKVYVGWFAVFAILNAFTGPVLNVLISSGLAKEAPKVVGVSALFFISLVYPMIHYFGIPGVIINCILSMLVWKIYGISVIYRDLGLKLLSGKFRN